MADSHNENYPKSGMYFEQARSRAIRAAKRGDGRIVSSLINQTRLGEGGGAARELTKEIVKDYGKTLKNR